MNVDIALLTAFAKALTENHYDKWFGPTVKGTYK